MRGTTNPDSSWTERHPGVVWCPLYAGAFAYLEQLDAHAAPFWSGIVGLEWLGVLLAFAAYTVFVGAITLAATLLLSASGLPSRMRRSAQVLSPALGALVLWFVLVLTSDSGWTTARLAFPVAVLAFAALALIVAARARAGLWIPACAALAGLATSGATLYCLHAVLLPFQNGATLAARVSVAWGAALTLLGGLVLSWPFKSRRVPRVIGIVVLALAAPVCATLSPRILAPGEDPPGPNLLFVTCDALRADLCGTYGGETETPHMDALSDRGARFERPYVMAPWTVPSLNGLFASDYPPLWRKGESSVDWMVRAKTHFFGPEEPTFAERAGQEGYATAAMLGNALLDMPSRLLRGFETIRVAPHDQSEYRGCLAQTPFMRAALAGFFPEVARKWPFDSARYLTRCADAYIAWNRNRRFFLWVHYMDPHMPYAPPAAHRPEDLPWAFYPPHQPKNSSYDPSWDKSGQLDAVARLAAISDAYKAEVRYVDACYGRLFEAVDASPLKEKTYVVLSSDHGEELLDRDGWSHGQSFYDEMVRVPLLFAGPGISATVIHEPVSTIDLLPTFADLLGLEPSQRWRGLSLLPLLTGEGRNPLSRPCFAGSNDRSRKPAATMIVKGRHKLIREIESKRVELFDLPSDPREQHNLAQQHPDTVAALASALDAWERSLAEPANAQDSSTATESLRRDTVEQMEALGYLE